MSDALGALRRFGTDAVSFQSLESSNTWWSDAPLPEGSGASIAYVDTGRSWIAVGSPLTDRVRREFAARRFTDAARARKRRAVFFGVESLQLFSGFRHLAIGSQAVFAPDLWQDNIRHRRRLREQLRRARAKGVTVRCVDAGELDPGTLLRQAVDRLRTEWLETRPMEPMGFLVEVELFHAPAEHLYIVAEWQGRLVEFVSAVPVYARGGWLIEDVLRSRHAPNGTTELVLDALLRTVARDADPVTPGLTPLAGNIPWPLRIARTLAVPLYDFSGLERFRRRLAPARWDPVYLVWDRGPAPLVIVDVIRAFARRRLLSFAIRSLLTHPNGPPFAVAVPLVPWTILLAGLAATGRAALLGFSRAALHGWVAFDAILAWLLFHGAHRPRAPRLAAITGVAAVDATLSLRHLLTHGFGVGLLEPSLRSVATIGPALGTAAVAWATCRAAIMARRSVLR